MDSVIDFVTVLVFLSGGVILAAVILLCALLVVRSYANRLWRDLRAVHDLHVLRDRMRELAAEGKMRFKAGSRGDE